MPKDIKKMNFRFFNKTFSQPEPSTAEEKIDLKIQEHENFLEHEIKKIFFGRSTFFALLGFVVGGLLVARSLWEYGNEYLGLPMTILIGVVVFAVSGTALRRFHK